MNAAESQRRAKAAWKERNAVAPIVKAGPEHPRWKGGRGETYRRLLATGKLRLAYNKRRDRMGGAVVLPSEIRAIGASQRWLCVACRVDISAAYEMDHIVPLSRGGRHEKHNIQLLCATCNRSKNAKHPIDFMQSRGYLL
jgi:5-methylcytosine-specific restriction endonuclease McrA